MRKVEQSPLAQPSHTLLKTNLETAVTPELLASGFMCDSQRQHLAYRRGRPQ